MRDTETHPPISPIPVKHSNDTHTQNFVRKTMASESFTPP